jgi:hypothetical protein
MRLFIVLLFVASCSGDGVSSDASAKAAYLGLDESIDKAITLGFEGFNAAQSANIPTEQVVGDVSGSMSIGGQVDQGQSANKQMRLQETLVGYADIDAGTSAGIVYTTADAGPAELDMSLQGIPSGTLDGTLAGSYGMTGTLASDVTLAISFSGALEAGDAGEVERKPGTTHITGTATSSSGTYDVDLTR